MGDLARRGDADDQTAPRGEQLFRHQHGKRRTDDAADNAVFQPRVPEGV